MPSGFAAQLDHWNRLGSGDLYPLSVSFHSCSLSSKIFKNKSQTIWLIRWASPSTPTSLRMMSWIVLISVLSGMIQLPFRYAA